MAIKILDTDKFIRENKLIGPVVSPQFFMGKTYNFHPEGLFSEEIFGIEGSIERKQKLSWIELNCQIIHPVFYEIMQKRIFRKINELLSGDKNFDFDENGELVETEDGPINGLTSFIDNIHKWKINESEDEDSDRNKVIQIFYDNIKKGTFFIDKLLVISPDYREVSIDLEKNDIMVNPMNDIYRSIIVLSNQLKSVSDSIYNILCYRMQLLIRDLYELIKNKVSKKSGVIRNLMLGKRVDFSARTVITPNPNLKLGEVGLPFRIACSIFEPVLLYGLINSPEAEKIPLEFHQEVTRFLGKELDSDLVL